MNKIWFQVLGIMVAGSILKYSIFIPLAWVIIDLAVLGIAYLLLRRIPFIDIKHYMIFLGGLTVINILVDLNIMNGVLGNLALLALLGYMIFGRTPNGRRR